MNPGWQEQHLRVHLDHRDQAVLGVVHRHGQQAQGQGERSELRADRHHPPHRVQQPEQEHQKARRQVCRLNNFTNFFLYNETWIDLIHFKLSFHFASVSFTNSSSNKFISVLLSNS